MGVLVSVPRFLSAGFAAITDSFNRADSTTTMGNTDTGQTWVPNSGTWGIATNAAYINTSTSQATTVIETSVSDCSVQMTLPVVADSGVAFRSSDDANNYITNATTLFRKQAGGFTSLGSIGTFIDGDVMKATLSGSSLTIYKNGASVLATTDSFNSTATKHGLRCNGIATARFDDFSVTVP